MVETPSVSLYTTLHVSPKMDQNGRFGTQQILRFRAGLRKHLLPSGEYAMHPLQRELRIKKAGIQVPFVVALLKPGKLWFADV